MTNGCKNRDLIEIKIKSQSYKHIYTCQMNVKNKFGKNEATEGEIFVFFFSNKKNKQRTKQS